MQRGSVGGAKPATVFLGCRPRSLDEPRRATRYVVNCVRMLASPMALRNLSDLLSSQILALVAHTNLFTKG
jgi:hypothetical protein